MPSQQTIRIFGSPSVLDKIDEIGTETIFPNDEVGEERMTVNLDIPSDVTLENMQSPQITVLVSVAEKIAETQQYSIKINYTGIGYGLRLSGDEPEQMTLSVTGSVRAMERFRAEWMTLHVDLRTWNEETEQYPLILTFAGDADLYRIELPTDTVKVVLMPIESSDSAGG
jgi:YbbR domain-containing protein